MGNSASKAKQEFPGLSASTGTPSSIEKQKPKPCCVCKDEKAARDECMLYAKSDSPEKEECKTVVQKYKDCMKGFGFESAQA